ncbi:hypothetical protein [Allomuricauda sp. SCSIO 65647]|uniref:hypothetical protein n=1 Tax=Allomuricauda sp. SCSIO 65647 TaxID=2908843 RepID=UPI001F4773BE|nr:hypothetical protein [Muricauda sp. SCSIO 65647]UJH66877.1 hypothetical protein L0P89_13035 [Muricauda sp. SCSIO 65647]
MKKILFFLFLAIHVAWAQKDIYESPRFEELSQDHELLAILPFVTNLDLKERVDGQELKQLAQQEGYAVQNALETYFSIRKKRKKFNVDFQNTDDTNAILAKEGITYENLDVYTIKELSEILNVDGIISGSLNLNILLSEGVPTNFSLLDYFNGNANYGRIGIKISDAQTEKLLWKYEKEITKKTGKNTNELIDRMMKQASRNFPYDREKKRKRKKDR